MSKTSRSRSFRNAAAQRVQAIARWREGLARIKEEGRLLWLLGEGMEVMLRAQESESAAPAAEQVAAAVVDWARQALAAPPSLRITDAPGLAKTKGLAPPQGVSAGASSGARVADTLLDGKPLSDAWCPVIWVGSREWGQCSLTTVVLGVGVDGRKRVLSVFPGSIREPGVANGVLADLTTRGLKVERGLLVVTEGSRTVDEALRQTWGPRVLVSHCRRQVLEDVASHVLEAERPLVRSQVVDAWALPSGEAAEALQRLARKLQRSAPDAAERLRRSIDATLVVDRLGASPPLKERLVSLGSLSQALERAHAWGNHGHGHSLADLLMGLSRWLDRTRRVMGWQQLGWLMCAIQEAVSQASAPPENENCTPTSKSGAAKGQSLD